MNSITEFKSEFSRVIRGYNPSEVDEAVEMLVSYAADLEQANAEFADANEAMGVQNDALIASQQELAAERDALRKELEAVRAEVENYRTKVEDANRFIAEAKRNADEIRAEAKREAEAMRAEQLRQTEEELVRLREACRMEETRYTGICHRVAALTSAVRNLWNEQVEALDALESMVPDEVLRETPAVEQPNENPAKEAIPDPAPVKKAARRAAMAAAVMEDEAAPAAPVSCPAEPVAEMPEEELPKPAPARVIRKPLPTTPPAGETIEFTAIKIASLNSDATPTIAESHTDGISVETVYRPATPATMKVTRVQDTSTAPTHSYADVRRSLEDINSRLK